MKSKRNSEWRAPHKCGECSEFDAGQRLMASGIEPAGWCAQCHGPVRPESPACPVFAERCDVCAEWRAASNACGRHGVPCELAPIPCEEWRARTVSPSDYVSARDLFEWRGK